MNLYYLSHPVSPAPGETYAANIQIGKVSPTTRHTVVGAPFRADWE